MEHPAVTETAEQLVELGFELSYAPVDKEGRESRGITEIN